jgi:hypothetical protein
MNEIGRAVDNGPAARCVSSTMNRPKKLLLSVVAVTAVAGCANQASRSPALPAPVLTAPTTTAAAAEEAPAPIPTLVASPATVATPGAGRPWRAGNGKPPPPDGGACTVCAND